ncbi:MAG: zinc dependent phospholipase C family protein [Deltaproteobacteria bacterium]
MPGSSLHIAIADRVADYLQDLNEWNSGAQLPNFSGPTPKELAALAKKHPNYFAFGAVGPDFFALLPDFRSVCLLGKRVPIANPLIGVVDFVIEFFEALDPFIEKYERYLGPIAQDIEEAISRSTGDLSSTVSDILGELVSLVTNALINLAEQANDWWGLFSLGLNKGYDNQDFFWMDMLHYRNTSQFAQNLWQLAVEVENAAAPDDEETRAKAEKLKAYALGYMTHVGSDVTGHPYVNEKSGGPFRTHWQRHHLVENHIDAKTYDDDFGSQAIYNMLTESARHYRISFTEKGGDGPTPPSYPPGDDSLRGLYVRRRHLDLDSDMPDDLSKFIFDCMDKTYGTQAQVNIHNFPRSTPDIIQGGDGRPDPDAIKNTYATFFRYMKLTTLDGFNHEKPEPPVFFPNLDFPALTDPHDDPPGESDRGMDFLDWLLAILRFVLWLLAVAIWIATIIPAIILDVATYGPRLAAYYAIQLPLYNMLKAQRAVMVMTGYLYPMQDEIDIGLVQLGTGSQKLFKEMLSAMDNIFGIGDAGAGTSETEPVPDKEYPRQQTKDADDNAIEFHHPWVYPKAPVEQCHSFAGPYESGSLPHLLEETNFPGSQIMRVRYERAINPQQTDQISFDHADKNNHLGDPVHFNAYLMWQLTRSDFKDTDTSSITDWNMDADRGYAYHCWDWNRHSAPAEGEPLDAAHWVLEDLEGHKYLEPCTPPPQAPKKSDGCCPAPQDEPNPHKPLGLHYLTQEDPGCDVEVVCARDKKSG